MKKILSIVILAVCLASPAFSQLRMNGWGRAVWVPVFYDYKVDEWRSTVQASYGEQPDLEFMFSAASTNIGVDVGMIVNASTINQIGNAKIWWMPGPDFKLHIGLGRVSALRGKVESSTGGYSYARGRITQLTEPNGKNEPIVSISDGDGIFSRFNLSKMGAIMEITPTILPGLFVGAAFAPEYRPNSGLNVEDVYQGLHVAVGYEIPKIGHIRLGYIGGGSTDPNGKTGNAGQNWDFSWDRRLEAAFALTAVPGLLLDMGFKWSRERHPGILDQPGFSLENPWYVALGAVYSGIDNLKIGFAIDGHFGGTAVMGEPCTDCEVCRGNQVTSAPQIAFNFYPSYNIGFCDVGADFTYGVQFGDEKGVNDKQMLGFGVYAQKPYGHGNIRVSVYANAPMNEGQQWGMSIPIWLTYSF